MYFRNIIVYETQSKKNFEYNASLKNIEKKEKNNKGKIDMDTSLIVALVGVGGALLTSAIAFISNIVIEKSRLSNERKTYISKALFDKEFLLYQELNEKMFNCASICDEILSNIDFSLKNPKQKMSADTFYKLSEKYINVRDDAQSTLGKCAAFINEDLLDQYYKLLDLFKPFAEMLITLKPYLAPYGNIDENILDEIKNNADEILTAKSNDLEIMRKQLIDVVKEVRKYMHSLED